MRMWDRSPPQVGVRWALGASSAPGRDREKGRWQLPLETQRKRRLSLPEMEGAWRCSGDLLRTGRGCP